MQSGFTDLEDGGKKKLAGKGGSLSGIDQVTPRAALVEDPDAYYPKHGGHGRPPIVLERMLRMCIAQQFFGLSDEGIEDAIWPAYLTALPLRPPIRSLCRGILARAGSM